MRSLQTRLWDGSYLARRAVSATTGCRSGCVCEAARRRRLDLRTAGPGLAWNVFRSQLTYRLQFRTRRG